MPQLRLNPDAILYSAAISACGDSLRLRVLDLFFLWFSLQGSRSFRVFWVSGLGLRVVPVGVAGMILGSLRCICTMGSRVLF